MRIPDPNKAPRKQTGLTLPEKIKSKRKSQKEKGKSKKKKILVKLRLKSPSVP